MSYAAFSDWIQALEKVYAFEAEYLQTDNYPQYQRLVLGDSRGKGMPMELLVATDGNIDYVLASCFFFDDIPDTDLRGIVENILRGSYEIHLRKGLGGSSVAFITEVGGNHYEVAASNPAEAALKISSGQLASSGYQKKGR